MNATGARVVGSRGALVAEQGGWVPGGALRLSGVLAAVIGLPLAPAAMPLPVPVSVDTQIGMPGGVTGVHGPRN